MDNTRTVTSQIDEVECRIAEYEKNLGEIEKSLRLEDLSNFKRQELLENQKRLQKDIALQDASLKQLRKENWKNMLLSVLVMVLVYLVYHSIWAP